MIGLILGGAAALLLLAKGGSSEGARNPWSTSPLNEGGPDARAAETPRGAQPIRPDIRTGWLRNPSVRGSVATAPVPPPPGDAVRGAVREVEDAATEAAKQQAIDWISGRSGGS